MRHSALIRRLSIGDIVRRLRSAGRARQDTAWACYHPDLYRPTEGGLEFGLVGCAVDAPWPLAVRHSRDPGSSHWLVVFSMLSSAQFNKVVSAFLVVSGAAMSLKAL